MPDVFDKFVHLKELNLSNNRLSNLPAKISILANLNSLDISKNEFIIFPQELICLDKLSRLNLSENHLMTLPLEIQGLESLVTLDVADNQLSALPKELAKLSNLESINLKGNTLRQIPNILFQMSNLKYLNLNRNGLSVLPSKIGNLVNLLELDVAYGYISKLPAEIKFLCKLVTLNLSGNYIAEIPTELGELKNLSSMYMGGNKIKTLHKEICTLEKLKEIDLHLNRISTLPKEIGQLTNLRFLDISQNKVKILPREIGYLSKLTDLDIKNNPIVDPPPELVAKGTEQIKIYFRSLLQTDNIPLTEVKVLFVGDGGSGKTSLVNKILGEPFNIDEPKTHGIKIQDWKIKEDGTSVNVHFWDFGGQQIMHATHQFFLSKRSLYILVLDGRKEEDAEYWLKHIESFAGNSPVLVVLNKMDEHPAYDINRRFLQEKYKIIKGFYQISCLDSRGINEFIKDLKRSLTQVELLKTTWPKSWFSVKTSLENMKKDFIKYEQYQLICKAKGIIDIESQNTLIDFLNDLGVVLHFKDLALLDTHVLDPVWITEAVYRIINSEELAESRGILKLVSLNKILKQTKDTDRYYPDDRLPFIINLMKKFELCYEIDNFTVLIPQLLTIQKPSFDFDYTKALRFFIQYDFLPKSIMPRFIVNMHRDILNLLRWRTGVILEDKSFGCRAVVESDESEKRIYVYVDGQNKRDYLAIIRYMVYSINSSYEKIQAIEKVPMPDQPSITVSYEHLLTLEKLGQKYYIPDGSEKEYPVKSLLGVIQSENLNEEEILRILDKLVEASDENETKLKKINNVITLKPNFFGFGLDINEIISIIDKYFKKRIAKIKIVKM